MGWMAIRKRHSPNYRRMRDREWRWGASGWRVDKSFACDTDPHSNSSLLTRRKGQHPNPKATQWSINIRRHSFSMRGTFINETKDDFLRYGTFQPRYEHAERQSWWSLMIEFHFLHTKAAREIDAVSCATNERMSIRTSSGNNEFKEREFEMVWMLVDAGVRRWWW